MCVSLLPMVIVESVFTDFTVAKCVILLHYVQNLRNSINNYDICLPMYRYTEKIFGKLGSLPALYRHSLHMASDLR